MESILKAAMALTSPSFKQIPRDPYTLDSISLLLAAIDCSQPLGTALTACFTSAFWGVAWVGELTLPNLCSINNARHIKPSNVHHFSDQIGLPITAVFLQETKLNPASEAIYWATQPRIQTLMVPSHTTYVSTIPPLMVHSLHIGGTLEYLFRGVAFDVVKAKGHWSSEAFLIYLQKHAEIKAPYMQVQPAVDSTFIQYIMLLVH